MSAHDIVDEYLDGRLNSWGVYRRLVQLGVSAATALAFVGALPAAVHAQDLTSVAGIERSAEEALILDELTARLAAQLGRIDAGGPIQPLAASLARAGANNNNLLNNPDCKPLPLNFNDGNVNLAGELNVFACDDRNNNLGLVLNGNIGRSNVNLDGTIMLPEDGSNGNNTNLGHVNLNFQGNVGDASLNFSGNLNNLLLEQSLILRR
jgi:hypothetical protein